ncbi:hypothetical protein MACH26_31220 [Planctobacterium marinum]|uniref:Uncharacterized protein n=1 Tax=Planctobacterium marinum TaxID=1631968 RepID=A0AA48HMN1_9ALTE|nr:hypothetical protein MACH26_31220 [Planctobacterium marinum]
MSPLPDRLAAEPLVTVKSLASNPFTSRLKLMVTGIGEVLVDAPAVVLSKAVKDSTVKVAEDAEVVVLILSTVADTSEVTLI